LAKEEPICRHCGSLMKCGHCDPREVNDLRKLVMELEAALRQIADGYVDEGGNRRNHHDATRIARDALKLT